jgi:hypothetical protein
MGRKLKIGLTKAEMNIIKAHCQEYSRRRVALEFKSKPIDVLEEYERLNGIIDAALSSIEVGIRMQILDDVAWSRGYFFSQASPFMTKETYYSRKKEFIHSFAKGLNFV